MTPEKTRELLNKYDGMIQARYPHIEPKDQSGHISVFGYQPGEKLLEHGRWMCQKALDFDGLVRSNRWLGFIQCILLIHRVCGLDDMRQDTRPGPEEAGPESKPPETKEEPVEVEGEGDEGKVEEAPEVEEGEPSVADFAGHASTAPVESYDDNKEEPSKAEGEVESDDADDAFERLTGEPAVDSEAE